MQTTYENMGQKKKRCEQFFNGFNLWYDCKEKPQICFPGTTYSVIAKKNATFTQQPKRPSTLLKKTPTQVFSCDEISKIFKNTFS